MSQSLDIDSLKRRNDRLKHRLYACLMACLTDQRKLALLRRRRDHIRDWLCEEETYTVVEQKHLDAHTPERAYWHHGYQTALHDIITLLTAEPRIACNTDTSNQSLEGDPDEPYYPVD